MYINISIYKYFSLLFYIFTFQYYIFLSFLKYCQYTLHSLCQQISHLFAAHQCKATSLRFILWHDINGTIAFF